MFLDRKISKSFSILFIHNMIPDKRSCDREDANNKRVRNYQLNYKICRLQQLFAGKQHAFVSIEAILVNEVLITNLRQIRYYFCGR